ncbi:MAG: DUF342 domain-containing protein [Clostridiales bacterium]|nr:DUF342 domain-containing protein [Clostridiales bacterium]
MRKKRSFAERFFPWKNGKNSENAAEEQLQSIEMEEIPPPERPKDEIKVQAGRQLTQAWQKWRGDAATLWLTVFGGENGCKLHLDPSTLEPEGSRLSDQLEKVAEKYLQAWEKAAKETAAEPGALCKVYMSADRMAAWLFLFPPFSPQDKISLEALNEAVRKSGVTTGIDQAAIDYVFQNQPYFELVPLACGTMPVEGADGTIRELYPRQTEDEIKTDESGAVDYHMKNYIQAVQKGDIICDILPPTEGTPGMRVDGQAVKPHPVKPAKVLLGANTAFTDDKQHVIAKMDGHLEYSHSTFSVRSILDVAGDVNYETGNIEYHGDVHIHGNVCEGFSVRAAGSVIIDGAVESAHVEAGGDVIVAGGILGDNRALIKSRSSVRAKYLENCVVYAGEGVYADCAIASQIGCDNSIVITTGRGTVIGGTLTAGKLVKAHIVGSKSGKKTRIILGVLPYTEQEGAAGEAELEEIHQELEKLEEEIRRLERQSGRADASAQLGKANLRKSVLTMKEERALKSKQRLESAKPDLKLCRFECSVVYPITKLTIQEYVHYFEDMKNSCIATLDLQSGEIKFH